MGDVAVFVQMIWKSETKSEVNPDRSHLQVSAPKEAEFKPKGIWTEQVCNVQHKVNKPIQVLRYKIRVKHKWGRGQKGFLSLSAAGIRSILLNSNHPVKLVSLLSNETGFGEIKRFVQSSGAVSWLILKINQLIN